jgi:hypothetical protein
VSRLNRMARAVTFVVAVLVCLFVLGVTQSHAAEATLTEVVEAVKADTAQVEALKAEAHTDSAAIAALLKAPVSVSVSGEPTVKIGVLPVETKCVEGCTGGASGSEVELTGKAKAALAEGNKESAVFIVGGLCGLLLCLVLWAMIRPRAS